jgi:hypothetical protein
MYGDVLVKGVPGLPVGYDFDGIDAAGLLKASAQNGRLMFPSGMSYRVLVLSGTEDITLPVLQKIKQLAEAGVPVVGPKPVRTPGLTDYPESEEKLHASAGSLKLHPPDKLPQVLKTLGLKPDFEVLEINADALKIASAAPGIQSVQDGGPGSPNVKLTSIHRTVAEGELYFVANPRPADVAALCAFRVSGKVPQLWNPETGEIADAPVYEEQEGRVEVPLRLPPSGSLFVLFRKASPPTGHAVSAKWSGVPFTETLAVTGNGYELRATAPGALEIQTASGKTLHAVIGKLPPPLALDGSWRLDFPPKLGAPEEITLGKLASWTEHPESGVKYFSGTAVYHKTVQIPKDRLDAKDARLVLDLGDVKNIAQVKLNGQDLGILWKPPFRVDVTNAARPGENELEIQVTNLWPNRLIGDEQLPPDCAWSGTGLKEWPVWLREGKPSPTGRIAFTTRHLWTRDDAPLPSGLLGPVALRTQMRIPVGE